METKLTVSLLWYSEGMMVHVTAFVTSIINQ